MQFNFIFRNFITKVRHFLVPLAVTVFESENFRVPFFHEK